VESRLTTLLEALIVVAAFTLAAIPLPLAKPYLALIDPAHGVASSAKLAVPRTARILVPDVPGSAVVAFDRWGVPHIYATTDEAGFYALGWVEASLRLFQMDVFRRIVEGRLAELIGPRGLPSDKSIVELGIPEAVRKQAEASLRDPALKQMNALIHYFILGINDYIDYIRDKNLLPPEYRLLGRVPEKWNYTDVYAVSKLPALLYSLTPTDLILENLSERLGLEVLSKLLSPGSGPFTANCNESRRWSPGPQPLEGVKPSGRGEPPSPRAALAALEGLRSTLMELTGGVPASTAFAVKPAFTRDHAALLSVDLHGSLTAPPMWMIVHLMTPSFQVAGLLLPGTPFVFEGRNARVAWALTASRADQLDFYYYKWNAEGEYYFNGTWHRPIVENVTVNVWDPVHHRMRSVEVTVRRTLQGPLIGSGNKSYAVAWTGFYPSNELAFLWRLNTAQSYRDALRAQVTAGTPLFNLVVVDVGGHIAWSPVGLLPIRSHEPVLGEGNTTIVNRGFLPFNASAGEGLWRGFIPKPSLRVVVDPRRPFIAVAGNPPYEGECRYPGGIIYYGYDYTTYRANRLVEDLRRDISKPLGISVSDAEAILTDDFDGLLLNITRGLVVLASRVTAGLSPEESKLLEELASWRGGTDVGRGSYKQSLALVWASLFTERLWEGLIGVNASNYPDAVGLLAEYTARLVYAYLRGEPWALNVTQRGYMEELAADTFEEAVNILKSYFHGGTVESWDYGELHYYRPSGILHAGLPGFSLPRRAAPGGLGSILMAQPARPTPTLGAPVEVGSIARLVVDMGSFNLSVSIAGGESGIPFSRHYSDIYEIWCRGEYVELNMATGPASIKAEARIYVNSWGVGGGT